MFVWITATCSATGLFGLLQHGAFFEVVLKVANSPECSGTQFIQVTFLLHELHWLLVACQVQFKVLVITIKNLLDQAKITCGNHISLKISLS